MLVLLLGIIIGSICGTVAALRLGSNVIKRAEKRKLAIITDSHGFSGSKSSLILNSEVLGLDSPSQESV